MFSLSHCGLFRLRSLRVMYFSYHIQWSVLCLADTDPDIFPQQAEEGQVKAPKNGDSNHQTRSEEHTSELQSLMRKSYAVLCLKKKNTQSKDNTIHTSINNKTQQNVPLHKLQDI